MKLKTHKGFRKRVKITKNKKVMRKFAKLSHFNAKETGAKTRFKRGDVAMAKTYNKHIKKPNPKI